jgi:N-methylhydantoinase A
VGLDPRAARLHRSIDARYVGQDYELPVSVDAPVTQASLAAFGPAFHAVHERVYGYAAPDVPVQLVSFRVVARSQAPRPIITRRPRGGADPTPALVEHRKVCFEGCADAPAEAGSFVECPVYDREHLLPGNRLVGPAIVEQMDATTVIPPDHAGLVDELGNLVIAYER